MRTEERCLMLAQKVVKCVPYRRRKRSKPRITWKEDIYEEIEKREISGEQDARDCSSCEWMNTIDAFSHCRCHVDGGRLHLRSLNSVFYLCDHNTCLTTIE